MFCFMKKVRLVLASPTHKKMRESLIFFPNLKKNVLHDHFDKGVKHDMKKIEISKKKLNEPKICMSLKIEFLGRGMVPDKNKMCSGKLS